MDILQIDKTMLVILTALFLIWNVFEGAIFESPYSMGLVNLYKYPLWRLALVLLIFFAALWNPIVAVMVASAVFFYFEDIHKLTQPWLSE